MGSSVSHLLGCFHRPRRNYRDGYPGVQFSEPLDEGLGHSFCYVRPPPLGSPPLITPDKSEELTGGGKQGPPQTVGADETLADAAEQLSSVKDEKGDSQTDKSRVSAERPGLSSEKPKTKIGPETCFKTISGASVSANTATPRSVILSDQFNSFSNVLYDRAAAFESSSNFSAIPLQPLPRGFSGPLSGPLDKGAGDKGFIPLSGPMERGFMSGPLERGFMSGPLDPSVDRSHYSAPLNGPYYEGGYARKRKKSLTQFMTTVGRPVKKAFVKTASSIAKTQKSIVSPVKNYMHNRQNSRERNDRERKGPGPREGAVDPVDPSAEFDSSELDPRDNDNVQWAQGKAGEDRVHVVISEERGWIFVGIYDGFNGPDAPDFLMSNLYVNVSQELQGLLWDPKEDENGGHAVDANEIEEEGAGGLDAGHNSGHGEVGDKGERVHHNGTGRRGHRARGDMIWIGERQQGDFGVLGLEQDRGGIGNGQGSLEEKSSTESEGRHDEDNSRLPLDKTDLNSGDGTHEQKENVPDSNGSCLEPGESPNGGGSPHEDLSRDSGHDARQERSASVPKEKLPEDSSNGEEDEIESERSSDQPGFNEASSVSGQDRKRKKKRVTGGLKFRHGMERRKEQIQKYFQIYDWDKENGGVVQKMKHAKVAQDPDCPGRETAVEHVSVLNALAKALEATENAYLDMADKVLYENPELALMGSCVLVMLMKDEDVYILNVGDSRAVLAQHPKGDSLGTVLGAAGAWSKMHANDSRTRDSLLRLELERIIEETPLELEEQETTHGHENRNVRHPPPTERPLLGALQLTTDHSTNIEEEVLRLKSEHPDDDIIENDRVKGKLKVTRAFGAGFLKQPKWNDALLEMFQINFVGTTPYMTCSPALYHHRLGPQDEFLVLSSDGLYQYFSNEEVVSHVEEFMKQFPDGDPAQHLIEQLLFRAAKKAGMDFHELLDIPQGDRRKYHDDVSVMVISLEGRIWRSSG